MKIWIVDELVENACGFDSKEIGRFETEAEAKACVAELEAEEIAEWGEVLGSYSYYSEDE